MRVGMNVTASSWVEAVSAVTDAVRQKVISVHVEDRDRRVLAKKIAEQLGARDVTTVSEERVSARYHA